MSNFPNIPTGRAIARAVRASLNLVGNSLELLTESQLVAIQSDLRQTLAIVDSKVPPVQPGKFAMDILATLAADSQFTDGQRVVLDLSDWEDESDGDRNSDGSVPNCKYSVRSDSVTTVLHER